MAKAKKKTTAADSKMAQQLAANKKLGIPDLVGPMSPHPEYGFPWKRYRLVTPHHVTFGWVNPSQYIDPHLAKRPTFGDSSGGILV